MIPKSTILERIRSCSGTNAADSASEEHADQLGLDSDADASLLRRYDMKFDQLREEFGGGSPSTG